MPFVTSPRSATFCGALANGTYTIEALTISEAGVVTSNLDELAHTPARDCEPDFEMGMQAVLSKCHVVLILCGTSTEAREVSAGLGKFRNTSCLVTVFSLADGGRQYFRIDPDPEPLDVTDWCIDIARRWEAAKTCERLTFKRKRTLFGLLFPVLTTVLLRRRFETLKTRKVTPLERCRDAMGVSVAALEKLAPPDRLTLQGQIEALCPAFDGHDALGKHYSNVFRTTCLLVPLVIAVAAVLSVAALTDRLSVAALTDRARHTVWHIVEGVLLLFAFALFVRSEILKHHQLWLRHRLVAELMRSTSLNAFLHTIPNLTPPSEAAEIWVEQSRLFWNHFRSLPPQELTTPNDDLRSARRSAIEEYARYQARFHHDFAEQHHRAHKSLTKLSGWAFVITLIVAMVQLAKAAGSDASVGNALLLLTLSCAFGAFVLSVLAHQLGFEAIAERSRNASAKFNALVDEIRRGAAHATAEHVYCWARQCSDIVLDEQHSWYRHVRLVRMHL